ncbi:hypothetical protein T492DRAFT_900328 [Pavlovales sp. CCMP2436]|nr:hypothetical protein T492DRAFT_900328 [Pavlovales sp. CCMP2436]
MTPLTRNIYLVFPPSNCQKPVLANAVGSVALVFDPLLVNIQAKANTQVAGLRGFMPRPRLLSLYVADVASAALLKRWFDAVASGDERVRGPPMALDDDEEQMYDQHGQPVPRAGTRAVNPKQNGTRRQRLHDSDGELLDLRPSTRARTQSAASRSAVTAIGPSTWTGSGAIYSISLFRKNAAAAACGSAWI